MHSLWAFLLFILIIDISERENIMSYRFIFGGSRSGKTYRAYTQCIEKAMHGGHYIVLVPEQASTEAEKEIVRLHPDHATDNIEVLSFNRLAYRVFEELSIHNPEVIDDITKAMILRRVAADHKKELKIWSRSFERTGFVDNLKSMISELYQYGIAPQTLLRLCADSGERDDAGGAADSSENEPIRGSLRYKLHDLSLIYTAFAEFIRDRYITLEEIPDVLAKNICKSSIIRDSVIVLDGFTGFTPIQYRIIENLLVYAKEVTFTVTWGDDASLFRMSTDMRKRIGELADKNQIRHETDVFMNPTGIIDTNPDISYLEARFLRFDEDAEHAGKKGRIEHDGIRIIRAVNMSEEVEAVVCDIERLVRKENERYRHIAIICGDIQGYRDILSVALTKAGMPFYIDQSLSARDNPLAAMIAGALGCISDDYSYDQMMRYLKTGLVTDDAYMINVLDSYMYVTGRRGYRRMSQEWTYMPRELKGVELSEINAFKDDIMSDFEPLKSIYSGRTACVRDAVRCIRDILAKHDAAGKLEAISKNFEQRGNAAKAREYAKVCDEVEKVLSRTEDLIGDDMMSSRDLADVIQAGIAQIKIGMIPGAADTIVVGDITRTRLDDIRYLYVIGVNEGVIPGRSTVPGTITDREREILGEHGVTLSPTAREDIYIQRYYLYRLFTKPAVRLTLSCAGMDGSGSAMRESYILEHIRSLYEQIPEMPASEYIAAYDSVKAMNIAADVLRERPEGGNALVAYLRSRPEYSERLQELAAAAAYRYEPTRLESATARALYGGEVSGSVTRFENYAGCPFMQFVQYGLEIQQQKRYSVQAVDIGNLVHSALEKIFAGAQRSGTDLCTSKSAQLDDMTERAVLDACAEDETGRYIDTEKNKYIVERLKKSVRLNLNMLIMQLREDGFTPRYLELRFDRDGVRGKIDRVDTKRLEDGRTAVRVIDYKTGNTKWDVRQTVQGRTTQLPIYMDAALKELQTAEGSMSDPVPAGMLYYHVDDPVLDAKEKEISDIQEELYKKAMPEGLINAEIDMRGAKASGNRVSTSAIDNLLRFVKNGYEHTRDEILNGEASAAPLKAGRAEVACTYCEYSAICGFDRKLPGYSFRTGLKIDESQAWKMIKEGSPQDEDGASGDDGRT